MSSIELIKKTLKSNATPEEFSWLENIISSSNENEKSLQVAFAQTPKYIKKTIIVLDEEIKKHFLEIINFVPDGWTSDRLARTFILLHFNAKNEMNYTNALNMLFETAEMNELAALYASLPLLQYPKNWLLYAKEAVRSNIGVVFDAIAFNNPYPNVHFDEKAWNQLVLKTIFSTKNIIYIYGLKERSNRELACMISDFAHERWAAGRTISPEVWQLVAPFIDNHLIKDMEKLFQSENEQERLAAKLCCIESDFGLAKELLEKYSV